MGCMFRPSIKFLVILCLFCLLVFSSCFLIKIPVKVRTSTIQDTIHIYHFILIDAAIKPDPFKLAAIIKESKNAYDWLNDQAENNGQKLFFKEHWMMNKDTSLGKTFTFKLPSKNISILAKNKPSLTKWAKSKTKSQERRLKIINWESSLLDSLFKAVNDESAAKYLNEMLEEDKINENALLVMHLYKASKSKIQGFYKSGRVYIGDNNSRTIAHETLHHLGAHDIYIHRFWVGARRHVARKKLKNEIMNFSNDKTNNCNNTFISSYTSYCMGWTNKIDKKEKKLLKQNLMAKLLFRRKYH